MITEVYQLNGEETERGRAAHRPLGLEERGGVRCGGAVFSAPPSSVALVSIAA